MKTLKLYIASIFLLIIPALNIVAQEEIAQVPTPNAADFGRFGDIPVSPYSGRANVEVPIYSTTQRGVTLDVKLTYDTSGLPMNGLPGWTGHGWSLNVGGVITRSARGTCDEYIPAMGYEQRRNYFQSPGALNGVCQNEEAYKDSVENHHNDFAPDVFYFNFMGKVGRFLFGNDGEWIIECEENLDVVLDVSQDSSFVLPYFEHFVPTSPSDLEMAPKTIKGFTIIDESGNRYIFGGNTSCTEYSIPFFSATPAERYSSWMASAWYLNQVQDRLGNVLYKFEYRKGYYLVQAYNSFYAYAVNTTFHFMGTLEERYTMYNRDFPYSLTLTLPIYLSKVTAMDGTEVSFFLKDWEKRAIDLYPPLYTGPMSLPMLKKGLGVDEAFIPDGTFYYLQTDDYQAKSHQRGGYVYTTITDQRDDDPLVTMGLKYLDSISVRRGPGGNVSIYELDYNTSNRLHLTGMRMYDTRPLSDTSIGFMGEYKFKYNHYENIPSNYLTTAIDHWGYYNGNPYNLDCLDEIAFHHTRDVDTICSQYGMLTEIQYPTGGISVLEYEQNRYERYWDNGTMGLVDSVGYAGGLRIKSITDYEDSTQTQILASRSYTYVDGQLQAQPCHFWLDWRTKGIDAGTNVRITSFNVQSIIPLTNSFGQHIGYSDVWETFADGSRKEYHYTNFTEFGDSLFVLSLMSSPVTPYDIRSERIYGRGKLLSLSTMDSSGVLWNAKHYRYRSDNLEKQYTLSSNAQLHPALSSASAMWLYGGIYKIFLPKYDVVSVIDSTRYGNTFIKDSISYEKQDYVLDMNINGYAHRGIMRLCNAETTYRNNLSKRVVYGFPADSTDVQLYNSMACGEYYN